jgi:hypothetical protein
MDDDARSEAEVIDLLGTVRFKRLRAGGWLTPFFKVPGHEGVPTYTRHLVELRLREDKALHPEERRPAAVTKAHRGTPEVLVDRDGQQRVVFREAGRLTPRVRTELEGVLALARRVFGRR